MTFALNLSKGLKGRSAMTFIEVKQRRVPTTEEVLGRLTVVICLSAGVGSCCLARSLGCRFPKYSGIHGPGCRIDETQSRFHFPGVGVARVGCGVVVQ